MSVDKQIRHIQPYNDVFYRSCFFNCYFSVVRSFHEELYPYLLNDSYSYVTDKDGYLKMESMSVYNPEKLMNLQGIFTDKQFKNDDLILNLKKDLLQERPIIIWMDMYAQPYRSEYLSKHERNCVLIFGIQENEQKFTILENRYYDNLSYEIRQISFQDVKKGYYGFHDYFNPHHTFHSYAAFYHDSKQKKANALMFQDREVYFLQNMTKNIKIMFNGLESFKLFINRLHTITNSEKLLQSFNQIMNTKKIEQYRLSYLPSMDKNVIKLFNEMIQEWEKARYQAAKMFFSESHILDYATRIGEPLERIIQMEKEYLEWLVDACEKERTLL